MKDKVIGSGKLKGVSKIPWEHKIRKGRGCPKKLNGPKLPKMKMGHKSLQAM